MSLTELCLLLHLFLRHPEVTFTSLCPQERGRGLLYQVSFHPGGIGYHFRYTKAARCLMLQLRLTCTAPTVQPLETDKPEFTGFKASQRRIRIYTCIRRQRTLTNKLGFPCELAVRSLTNADLAIPGLTHIPVRPSISTSPHKVFPFRYI